MAEEKNGSGDKRRRGGPRGPRKWRENPTARDRVMTQSLAAYIKNETGREVSPETVRAVRHCLRPWAQSDAVSALRKNMDRKLEKAKLQEKREKALALLREAESELEKYSGAEVEEEDEEEEDEDSEDDDDDLDDDDDEDEDDDENDDVESVFGDDDNEEDKVFN